MTRILTAVVLIPAAVWLAIAAPLSLFLAALALVGVAAHREFDSIAAAQGIAPAGWLGALLGVAWLLVADPYAQATLVIVALLLIATAIWLPELGKSLPHAVVAVLGVVYIFGAWRAAAALRQINPHWLMLSLLVSWAGDTAAMYVGKSIGKHKLAPRISPGKTWEGSMGSVAGGVLAALIYAHYLLPGVPPLMLAVIAAMANIAGQLGDLAESAFKRGANMKDSGSSLPGHGGWLDRIDSSLFSVPATYALVLIWIPAGV